MNGIKKSERKVKQNVTYQKVCHGSVVTVRPRCDISSTQSFITDLHHALAGSAISNWGDLDFSIRVRLRVVAQRLENVRRLGGAYAQVALSPEIEAMMALMPKAEDVEHEILVH